MTHLENHFLCLYERQRGRIKGLLLELWSPGTYYHNSDPRSKSHGPHHHYQCLLLTILEALDGSLAR